MINKNELRLGNYVTWDDDDDEVYFLKIIGVAQDILWTEDEEGDDNDIDFKSVSPIRLSDEILEKCGFVKQEGFWSITWGTNGVHIIKKYPYYEGYSFELGKLHYKIVDYLHQLQNLFFALTGTELIIGV